jgi:hypothetical protein
VSHCMEISLKKGGWRCDPLVSGDAPPALRCLNPRVVTPNLSDVVRPWR